MKPLQPSIEGLRTTSSSLLVLVVLAARPLAGSADGAELPPPAQTRVDFVRDVRPILARHCYSCHGPAEQENDLRWDVKAAALKGGTSGLAIVPGKSAESRMIHLVAGLEKNLVMPKKGARLTSEQIGLLRAWIDQGAAWPDEAANAKPADKSDWWSFKPASRPALPEVKNKKWARNPIDLFVLAKLEAEKLSPSPESDRRTLIRRLSFDLTGLPPTPEEVGNFLRDKRKDAYKQLVDRLLASPRYGERWARHWLDTVHYGESHGYDKDKPRLNAWPYRDYVIRALNQDKPYSRFVQEQLAGDVLFPDEPDGVVALGFIAAGPWDFVGHVELPIQKTDGLIARYNDRDDMVMTTLSTFQSLTVHCARCHDHKFDPITQKDYYALQAVFAGVDRAERVFDPDKNVFVQRRALLQKKQPLEERHTALTNQIAKISSPEIEELDGRLSKLKEQLAYVTRAADKAKSPGNGYHSGIEPKPDTVKWVQVDLGQSLPLDEVRLIPARPVDFPDTLGFGFPIRFRVEISDNADFVASATIADHTAADFKNPGDTPVPFPANKKPARFVRVTATRLWERTSDYVFALAEMQVLVTGTNAALGAAVSALDSIEAGTWSKKFLVDGFDSRRKLTRLLSAEESSEKEKLEAEVQALVEKRRQLVENLTDEATRSELARVTSQRDEINREIAALPPPKKVYAAASDFKAEGSFLPAKTPRPVYLLARGDVKKPGDLVSPGGIACVPGPNPVFVEPCPLPRGGGEGQGEGERVGQKEHPTSNIQHPTSNLPLTPALSPSDGEREVPRAGPGEGWRRAALARWITDPKNLLTRRSIVNRVWHYHFGRGLVETPNDFGHMGALPTHPELLDWLAFWFQDNGESLKQLHRLMVTSAAYRQSSSTASGSGDTEKGKRRKGAEETVSSAPPPLFPSATVATRRAIEIDADNRYLWRMNRARLDAETVHDSMLLISGKLDPTMGGPAVQQFYFKDDHSPIYDYTQFDADSPAACRRSIYRFIVRSVPDPLMESLDCPDASLLAPKRNVTVTALQALAILNNPFVLKQCEHLAKRVAVERESRPSGRRAGLPARSGSDSRATSDFSRRASASESAAAEDSRAPDARRANAGDLKSQIERVYQLALNRQPTAAELEKLVPFAEKHGLANACRVIFNSSEFIFVD